MPSPRIKIVKTEKSPEAFEIMAASIVAVGKAAEAILSSGLKRNCIETLLYDFCKGKVGRLEIRLILDALPRLRGYYTTK